VLLLAMPDVPSVALLSLVAAALTSFEEVLVVDELVFVVP
jgi:hypothetical protein